MANKKNSRAWIVYDSIYAIIGGLGIDQIAPYFTDHSSVFTTFLKSAGVLGITYYALHWSKFDRIFQNMNLGIDNVYPIQKSVKKGNVSDYYKFTLPTGLSVSDIENKKEHIEQHFGKSIDIHYLNHGLFGIEMYHDDSQHFFDYEPLKLDGNVPILIGKDRKGNIISFELASVEPHMYISGETGCGKSTVLRSIITNLILTTNVNLHLIDLKHGVELALFEKCKRVIDFARTVEEADDVLINLCNEIEHRYTLFDKCSVNDIYLYNKKFKKSPMSYEVLVVDEMVDFKRRRDIFEKFEVIGAKARSCGIHMILSTQRPDKDILNGLIKNNITNVLGLRTKDATNSRIICDEEGLEKLKGNGHGIFYHKGKTEIQTPFLTYDAAKILLKDTYTDKKKPRIIDRPINENVVIDFSDLEVFQK